MTQIQSTIGAVDTTQNENLERLLGLAFSDEKTGAKLLSLPQDIFGEHYKHYRAAINHLRRISIATGQYELTHAGLKDILLHLDVPKNEICPMTESWMRIKARSCKLPEVETIIANLLDQHDRKQISRALRNRKMTIEEAREQLNKTTEHPLTDVGNRDLFIDRYGHDLRYVPEWKSWLVWSGRQWVIDRCGTEARKRAAKLVKDEMLLLAKGIKDDDRRTRFIKWSIASQSKNKIDAMVNLAETELSIRADQLDQNTMLLNVQNGTIDLQTCELREHRRDDLITKISPAVFDQNATAPVWDAFIARIFQDEDGEKDFPLIQYVQSAVGYSMTGSVSEQCFFILHGNGMNGKSTFMESLKSVLGDYCSTPLDSVVLKMDRRGNNSDDEAALKGVRMAACSETNEGQRFDESKIKRLTGNENVTAMRKFESPVTFPATWKIWLDCNYLPRINGTDLGIWRRVKTIPFIQTIAASERDSKLHEKFRAEASGILNWMMTGLKRWQKHGLQHEPDSVREAVKTYRNDADTLGQFLTECTTDGPADRIETNHLYRAYQRWCEDTGLDHPMTKITLGKKMKERGYTSKVARPSGTRAHVRFTIGLSLRSDDHSGDPNSDDESPYEHVQNRRENQNGREDRSW